MSKKHRTRWGMTGVGLGLTFMLGACATAPHVDHDSTSVAVENSAKLIIEENIDSYCKAGTVWGNTLRHQSGALYGVKQTNPDFVTFLRTGKSVKKGISTPIGRFYFGVSNNLKQNFNACFRTAYTRMDADAVLGQHVAKAAHDVGAEVGHGLSQWPLKYFGDGGNYGGTFDNKANVDHALLQLEHFNELLTVGSPADRQAFKVGFVCHYRKAMTSAIKTLGARGVRLEKVKELEKLEKGVTCDTRPMASSRLIWSSHDGSRLPGQIYANHPLQTQAGFRVFTGEELYLRFYRRALHEAGLDVSKKLYHGLLDRSDGIEYVRNLSLAIDKQSDLHNFFAPGFMEGFATDGSRYLTDMFCAVDKSACPVFPTVKHTKAKHKKMSSLQQKSHTVATQQPQKAPLVAPSKAETISQIATMASVSEGEGPCFVQIGAFAEQVNTVRTTKLLNEMDVYNVLAREITLKEQVPATQLRVGPYTSRQDAAGEYTKIKKGFSWNIGGISCAQAKLQ